MPITEWLGPSPWLDRMKGLVGDVFKHAPIDDAVRTDPVGRRRGRGRPSSGHEPALLDDRRRTSTPNGPSVSPTASSSARDLLDRDRLVLRDHGSEIIGGLSEACVLAYHEDPRRWAAYRPRFRAVLDRVLEVGRNAGRAPGQLHRPEDGHGRQREAGRHLGLCLQRLYDHGPHRPRGRALPGGGGPGPGRDRQVQGLRLGRRERRRLRRRDRERHQPPGPHPGPGGRGLGRRRDRVHLPASSGPTASSRAGTATATRPGRP